MVSTRSHDHTDTISQDDSKKSEESHSMLEGRQKVKQDPNATQWRKKVKRTSQHSVPAPTNDLIREGFDNAYSHSHLNHNVEGSLVQRFSHVEVEQADTVLSQQLLDREAAEEVEQPDDKLGSREISKFSETSKRNAKTQNGAIDEGLKGTHTRFSNEDSDFNRPESALEHELNAERDEPLADAIEDESDYKSEDEAPETLTAATGFDEAYKAAAEIARLEEG